MYNTTAPNWNVLSSSIKALNRLPLPTHNTFGYIISHPPHLPPSTPPSNLVRPRNPHILDNGHALTLLAASHIPHSRLDAPRRRHAGRQVHQHLFARKQQVDLLEAQVLGLGVEEVDDGHECQVEDGEVEVRAPVHAGYADGDDLDDEKGEDLGEGGVSFVGIAGERVGVTQFDAVAKLAALVRMARGAYSAGSSQGMASRPMAKKKLKALIEQSSQLGPQHTKKDDGLEAHQTA